MCWAVNKTTLQFIPSGDTKKYLDGNWLINPDLPDCEQKYWRIYSGVLKEMTILQKQTVDDAEIEQHKEDQKTTLIENKLKHMAIAVLIADGVLDQDGNLK